MYAEFRATNDMDIVADFERVSLRELMNAFDEEFLADADQAVATVRENQSFNLIHRSSYLKIDFFPAVSPFNQMAITRAERVMLGTTGLYIRVASREDILLAKMRWYRLGDESSDQQRRDIMGIVAMKREMLDRPYLSHWAAELGVQDLLERFLGSG